MTTIDEGWIRFGFGERWHVERWDTSDVYARGIVDDPPSVREPRGMRAAHDSERTRRIQQKLAWLTARVLVEDPFESTLPDVTAESLQGAGGR